MSDVSGETLNIFVYGALMIDPRVQASARVGTIDDWAVRFCARGAPFLEPSFAGLVEAPGDVAHGLVATVDEATWQDLSRAEVVYERRHLEAATADGPVDCIALVLPDRFRIAERAPSARYADKLARGAALAGLPDAVVAHYRALARTGSRLSTRMSWFIPMVSRLVPYMGVRLAVVLVLAGLAAALVGAGWVLVTLLGAC